jgi:prevent-host-death family protein
MFDPGHAGGDADRSRMKTIDIEKASGTLAEYVRQAQAEPLVLTDRGTPRAVLLSLSNADLETVSLSTNPAFLALIERSRARQEAEGGLSAAEMRRGVLSETETPSS